MLELNEKCAFTVRRIDPRNSFVSVAKAPARVRNEGERDRSPGRCMTIELPRSFSRAEPRRQAGAIAGLSEVAGTASQPGCSIERYRSENFRSFRAVAGRNNFAAARADIAGLNSQLVFVF